jgi:hypothetical protein
MLEVLLESVSRCRADQKQQILIILVVLSVLQPTQRIGGLQDTRLKLTSVTIDRRSSCVTSMLENLRCKRNTKSHKEGERYLSCFIFLVGTMRSIGTQRSFVDDNSHATVRFETILCMESR